jgi:thiol-disulfide isomerase/thioredoxin
VETQKWWKKQSELWVDCHTDEQFYHEINSGDRLVFVGEPRVCAFAGTVPPQHSTWTSHRPPCCADFFATWCNGCQRSYPELCKLAMDPEINKKFKFVKVRRPAVHAAKQAAQ